MRSKFTLQYFAHGLALANKSLDLFLINFSFSVFLTLLQSQRKTTFGGVSSLLSLILVLLSAGFAFSIPLFLVKKQQKKFSYTDMLTIMFANARRLIIPFIEICVFFTFFVILSFVFLFFFFHDSAASKTAFMNMLGNVTTWNPTFLTISILGSFFVFTPIFFSVEHVGIFRSLKKSVRLGWESGQFLVPIMIYNAAFYSVTVLLPINAGIEKYLFTGISLYLNFIIMASALVYYQRTLLARQ